MRLTIFLLLCYIAWIKMYNQTDYTVISERWEMEINPQYFSNLKDHNFKYNRTYHAFNMSVTIKVNFGNSMKGTYTICNWQPNYHQFPPFIPSGSYRLDFNLSYSSDQVAYIQWYARIKRDFD